MNSRVFSARWIFPVDQPPIPHGMITVADGVIVDLSPAGRRSADVDFGNAAILPGFVNAHTHLDLSDAAGLIPPTTDFTGWLRRVIEHRRKQSDDDVERAIATGIAQLVHSGTTLVGDISAQGASFAHLALVPLDAVVFHEVLGLSEARAEQTLRQAREFVGTCRSPRIVAGLSPHAPYSVRPSLFRAAADSSLPVAIHLAETLDEIRLLDRREGPFVDFLEELGIWNPDALASGLNDILDLWRSRSPGPLFIHGNYLDSNIDIPGSVIYCPRTHAAFGHRPHPFRELLARGVNVALGTDSLASNPDLDILEEACFLRRIRPETPGDLLLRMLTLNGAIALNRADDHGSLTPGKTATFVVLPLRNRESHDPHDLVFESSPLAPREVCANPP